jgi:hypothetical protein
MGMKVNGTSGLTFPDTTTLASAGQASVRAWVNFNGTGTVAIRAAFNVVSITDNGTGDYTVNFTTAMPDADYSRFVNGGFDVVATSDQQFPIFFSQTPLTTSFKVGIRKVDNDNNTFAAADSSDIHASIFR